MPVAAEVAVGAAQDLLEGHLGVDVPGDGAEFLERLDEVEDDHSSGAMSSRRLRPWRAHIGSGGHT
jgi:hypothetical protein